MDLTAVIACKDRAENLAYCLRSISCSVEVPAKVIVVDFGSTPDLTHFEQDYPGLVSVIRVTDNTGLFHKSRALNIGLRAITTKYVCMTDADQVYHPTFFKSLIEKLAPSCLVMSHTYLLREIPPWYTVDSVGEKYNDLVRVAKMSRGEGCCQSAETNLLMSIGGYDESYVGWGYEDTDLIHRAKIAGATVQYLPKNVSMVHLPHSRATAYYSSNYSIQNKNRLSVRLASKTDAVANVGLSWGALNLMGDSTLPVPVSIVVPTYRSFGQVESMIRSMEKTAYSVGEIVVTCTAGSAAVNRNFGLAHSRYGIVIMVDDDMDGFFPGWDTVLLDPLIKDPEIVMISARLIRPNGKLGCTMGDNYDVSCDLALCTNQQVPTACVAFKKNGLHFDEGYIGSGFEDTDYCRQISKRYPQGKFVINNKCRLVHINEMKNQQGRYWEANKAFFLKKWGKL